MPKNRSSAVNLSLIHILSVRQSFDVVIATIESLESVDYDSMEAYADDLYDFCPVSYTHLIWQTTPRPAAWQCTAAVLTKPLQRCSD